VPAARARLVPARRWRRRPLGSPPRKGFPSAGRGCPPRRRPPECVGCSCSFSPQLIKPLGRAAGGGGGTVFHRKPGAPACPPLGPIVRIDSPAVLFDDL